MVNDIVWGYILLLGAAMSVHVLFVLRGLIYLRVVFPRIMKPGFVKQRHAGGIQSPSVQVFVPCKGLTPELKDNIEALLSQDYPDFTLFVITESKSDPAAPLLASMAAADHRLNHVVAGYATRCCQKNHNLLKGIDYAKGQQPDGGAIYVFADMDIRPSCDWLKNITLPLADKGVFAVSGFRSLLPRGKRFAEHLHTSFNALQCLAMTEKRYAGMWGGSMALQRSNFEKYAVGEKWSTAMVDDLSLTAVIKKNRLKRVFSPDCLVYSRDAFRQLPQVLVWFTRQALYAAVYLRLYLTLGLCLNSIMLVGIFMLPIALIMSLSGLTPGWFAAFHVCFLVTFVSSIWLLSSFRKQRGFEMRWLIFAPLFLLFGTYCGWRGFFSKRMVWAGIVYHVDYHGIVLAMERSAL